MAYSLALPSVSLKNLSFTASDSLTGCHRNGIRGFGVENLTGSRLFMSLSVGTQTIGVVDDSLFADYKANFAFLFPGQVSTC